MTIRQKARQKIAEMKESYRVRREASKVRDAGAVAKEQLDEAADEVKRAGRRMKRKIKR